ncbi:translational activator [Patellaria atrata CBS 101060]|uniref:eIF-2-alpha kinase activator GCN1 n=1 Tax=Patellaria atrata CBS 101060 TaxID=1346257 RepID=A0A9P4VTE4_9PEZI|nr:translational activator [Patellaria atrata CBS 101060]
MAEEQVNGAYKLDREKVRNDLFTSRTKVRISELNNLNALLIDDDISDPEIRLLIQFFFDTHPLYIDGESRRAVDECLKTLVLGPKAQQFIPLFVESIVQESRKTSIASSNALRLLEWCSLLLQLFSDNTTLWDKWGITVVGATANLLETCLGVDSRDVQKHTGKPDTNRALRQQHGALVVSRRALRRVFRSKDFGHNAINTIVTALTSKGSSSSIRNAPLLGVVAGVSARIDTASPTLTERKQDYFTFYVREILSSRVVLPRHIANALRDFFESFTIIEDLQKEIVPAVEKGLLRAPEVLLNDLVTPLVQSLAADIDLTVILQKNLLKPLLSNIKSSNPTIRTGALSAFEAIAARCNNEEVLSKIADEILNPLKQSKVTTTEQKIIHAQMLSALKPSTLMAKKIPSGLAPVALKEANESAAAAEIRAMSEHLGFCLHQGLEIENAVVDTFTKGLVDKRPPIRKLWALRAGDLLWNLTAAELRQPNAIKFETAIMGKLLDIWTEIIANTLPALQNGIVTVAYVVAALGLAKLNTTEDTQIKSLIQKAAITKYSLVAEPKPSFLLNPRVYTKIHAKEDTIWILRALLATTQDAINVTQPSVQEGWAQVVIFFVVAADVPPVVRLEARRQLTLAYASEPGSIGQIIIKALWLWHRNVEENEKDSPGVSSKTGCTELYKVVRSICLSSDEASELQVDVPRSIITNQLIDLLVLSRSEIIPRISWIELCLRTGVDPGNLVRQEPQKCLEQVLEKAESKSAVVRRAAYSSAADLAFVAPETAIPLLIRQLESDLDPAQLDAIGPTEAAIYRTPEGSTFIDVLSAKGQNQTIDKSAKDYDTLKWEEELRAQLAQKRGQSRKLTATEQTKVNVQLAKEAEIRKQVSLIESKLRRGVGIIESLARGPRAESIPWLGPAVELLFRIIVSGAGLLLGEAATSVYLLCSDLISFRLGPLKQFIGVATLRSAGTSHLPPELEREPLGDLVTRVLYRMRFMGEQRPFDNASLIYMLPLVCLVLEHGGIVRESGDEADEQILLALEFLSSHADSFADPELPRDRIFQILISSMQKYTQHFKLVKDCFSDLCRSVAQNLSETETGTILKGIIVAETPVRTAVLQAVDSDLDLTEADFYEEIWLACHDDVPENSELGRTIWEENDLHLEPDSSSRILPYLERPDKQLRRAAARSLAEAVTIRLEDFPNILLHLETKYIENAKPRVPERDEYGMPRKVDLRDPWESRDGIALAFKELAQGFQAKDIMDFMQFMVHQGPLGDSNAHVRDGMVGASIAIIATRAQSKVEELMGLFETALDQTDKGTATTDKVNEAVVILYGALARHLKSGDARVLKVVQRLLDTLSTPSETVQYAVAECLPPLVQASSQETSTYIQQMMDELLKAKKYAARRGAAYGLAGIVKGKGLSALREFRIMSTLQGATENKKDVNQRQGAFLAYELFSHILGRLFEPYVIQIVPQLLAGFGDSSTDVREACLDAAKTCFASLSSFGVNQILPILLEGLDEQQWRSKKGACDSLGAMAYLDPQQLALSLPDIIPPLTNVLTDSHKEVRLSANRSLQRFGEVISNPEIKGVVNILLKALSDPTKYTDDALDALIKISFIHYLDAPSLALVVRILERGLADRSVTKRKAAQIIGSLAHLTERKDLITHLPILVAGLRAAIVDPVPTTRATASKALGSLIEKLGEDALPDLIPSLMATLKSDTGAGDRLGSAQALSEVLAGLGTGRLEETLPTILQNVSSSKSAVREGFMSLFIFLPACFGNSFANYLSKIIPPILGGLADDIESIRETALRAGRLLVKNFATRAIDLLLPELERGLADDSHRIRLSSVELVGDLLFNLTGISAKAEEDEAEENAKEAGQSLLEVLGEDRRNKVLSALYICRCDTSGLVRTAAINVWKALVATPRTLRELIPTLTQLLIRRLASSNMEQKVIAGNALGELIRKAGEGVLATLLPTLEEGLQTSTDSDARQGICIALRELITSASNDTLEDYEKTLISVVRTALVDADADVREAAAEAFDALQRTLGKKAIDQVLPHLLHLLSSKDDAQNALSALLTLLTDNARSNVILPNLLPTLLTSPITAFNARAIASLAEVAGAAMTRKLPNILNALMDNLVTCKDSELMAELDASFDAVLLSVDEYDGLNTAMSVMLVLAKHDDHRKRCVADNHLATFFSKAEIDISRYYPDLIRALLIAFDDPDKDVVRAAWSALSELTKRLKKEEMESLVISTRQVLQQVGVPGSNLAGFSLPKGINSILPIFLQGLMNGSPEQRTQAALAISDIVDRTSADSLKPFVTQITGPLIRVVSERSTDVKAAILITLNNLLEKIPMLLRPFLPQLQRTFAKSLADTSSEILRVRAAKALGTLITLTTRVDPLISELVLGSKTSDVGVRNAMLKALYEVVSKAGKNMNEASRTAILSLIDTDVGEADDSMAITNAKLLGALIENLPSDMSSSLIKSRVLTTNYSKASVLALNSILVESPETLVYNFGEETLSIICQGIGQSQPFIADNCVLAAGKYLLTPTSPNTYEAIKPLFEALAPVIAPGNPVDTRRLALVVIRTVARNSNGLVRPHIALLTPPVFASVRDTVIPVKLSAEAAFLAIFDVVEEEAVVFEKYMAGPGAGLPMGQKRSMQDYFKRVAVRLAGQARERKEAEGGQGGLGLSSDEVEDEREVWSVGRLELGDIFSDSAA